MFCNMCGNKIEENSIFCNRCGARMDTRAAAAPAEAPTAPAAAVPQPAEATVQNNPAAAPINSGEPAGGSVQFGGTAGIQFPGANSTPAEAPVPDAVPHPVESARSGWSTEVRIQDKPQKPTKAEKPRKYYTGAHLALCLVTTGIMAMAAGVFAALYFMTVL
ncbi:MAG: zinc-ribbon domain-containing protein [Oscillospiraceae bacterium]|nr:zinc-ribbon domain-containing protein [Oscillospiraceae bacterium]